jgi:hypothetical protein
MMNGETTYLTAAAIGARVDEGRAEGVATIRRS